MQLFLIILFLIFESMLIIVLTLQLILRKKAEKDLAASEERLKFALEGSRDGVWEWNAETGTGYFSKRCKTMLKYEDDSKLNTLAEWDALLHPEDACNAYEKVLLQHVENNNFFYYNAENRFLAADGTYRWILDRGKSVKMSADGKPLRVIGIRTDITDRVDLQESVQEAEKRYRNVIENSHDASYSICLDTGDCEYISPVIEKITGYKTDEIQKSNFNKLLSMIHPEDAEDVRKFYENSRNNTVESYFTEFRLLCADGRYIWLSDRFRKTQDAETNKYYQYGLLQDITEQKTKEEEILFLSYHDVLTGLYNRRYFEKMLSSVEVLNMQSYAIILGDINGLKLTNDIFGHLEGDKILLNAARIMTQNCRPNDMIARWGGDEFIIFMPNATEEEAGETCKRIQDGSKNYGDGTIKTSISLGYAGNTSEDQSIMKVLKRAEDYMFRHKLLESRSLRSSIVASIMSTLYEKSHEVQEHAERLKKLCREIADEMGISPMIQDELELLAVLHDIGKIAIKDTILNKPDKLTESEWQEIKRHPEIGYQIAKSAPELIQISDYILSHHEHWDGTGYPRGLKGEEIPILARILAVVDAFDAMTNDRPYRKALSEDEAVLEMLKNASKQFDPEVIKVFCEKVLIKERLAKAV